MSERSLSTDGIERRGFLSAVAVGLGGAGLSHHALARESSDATYVLEQDGQCVPITPLSGDETVEEFYDYRTPNTDPSGPAYSSYGTTHLQRPETSILFLYDGPEGLSLVVVHDELDDGTNGGAVTFRFENLTSGEWVVGDDIYDGESNYDRFQETDNGWKIDWTWTESRSDGGAYRPLGDDFAVTVDPAFNEEAALYGDPYEGEITDWHLLSGDADDPERVSLSLTDPITIRAGNCEGVDLPTTVPEETTEEDEETDEDESSGPIRLDVEVAGRVNPRSRGRLPVVVYSSAEFDATTIDPGSVELRPGGAAPGKSVRTDENGDGHADLKLLFWMEATDIDGDTASVELTGQTRDGREVVGTADVRLVPQGDDDDDHDGDDDRNDDDHDDDDRDDSDDEHHRDGDDDDHDDDDDDEWEDREDKWEEKEEKWEEKREEKAEKWEDKKEEMEEKWEKKKEKWEKKKKKRKKKRDDDDDD